MRRNIRIEDVAAMQLERRRQEAEAPALLVIKQMDRSFLALIVLALAVSGMAIWFFLKVEEMGS